MDLRAPRATAPLSLALIITMLCGIVFAAAPAAEAQGTCLGQTVTVNIAAGQLPTSGNDVIMGTNGADNIHGKGGNDRICGGGGRDVINGGPGHDIIDGGGGADTIYGGSTGNDTIYGGTGGDKIWGRNGNDTIYGQGGGDKIYGEAGHDIIWGGNGPDILWGGTGNDQLNGDGSNDKLYGESGTDTLHGGYGTDFVNGGGGATDTCTGETQTNCENLQAPEWVDSANDDLTLAGIGLFDFSVSWDATTGGTPDVFELTIRNAAGASQLEVIDAQTETSFDVLSFQGHALDPAERYHLELVAVNAAGRSRKLELTPVSVLSPADGIDSNLELSFDGSGASASYASGSSTFSRIVAPKGGNDCPIDPLYITSWKSYTFVWIETGRHEAKSLFCTDGTNVTSNDTSIHECTRDAQSETDGQVSDPPGAQPNSPIVRNLFLCGWEGELSAELKGDISAALSKGKVSDALNIELGGTLNFDGTHSISHTIEVDGDSARVRIDHWSN